LTVQFILSVVHIPVHSKPVAHSPYDFLTSTKYVPPNVRSSPQNSNYVTWNVSQANGHWATYLYIPLEKQVNGRLVHGSVFNLTNPMNHFGAFSSAIGCPGMIATSVTSKAFDCVVAMNAGYFNVNNGACHGNIISNGQTVQLQQTVNVNFGITTAGDYVIGYLDQSQVISMKFLQIITGVGWLVKNGAVYINNSINIEKPNFGWIWERAARTAIGHDVNGNLVLLQVDGNEELDQGVNVFEWANIVSSFNLQNAINLDGGGSVTVFTNNTVVNQMGSFCGYRPVPCERKVSSVVCIV
jgi:exopolysaccharide biosynthesis protein